jgi:hypothetical protein
LFLSILIFGASASLRGQEKDTLWLNDEWYYSTDDTASIVDLTKFLPGFFKNEALLKRYLRDDTFYDLRKTEGDTLAVDAIFDRAMLLADDDVEDALWIATFAVMDHQKLGLRIPLIGSVYFPLTTESDSLFRVRRTNLPKRVLSDKKQGSDKDKLQHFFGSALIAYISNSDSFTRMIGDLFEIGEDKFVLGGRNDPRDKSANEKGREFGLALTKDKDILPSDILWK